MSDVLFRSGSFELLPGARERLAKVSGIVLAYPSLHVAIEGHTDSVGSDQYNQDLSEHRAQSVRDYFVQQGISANAIEARGIREERADCVERYGRRAASRTGAWSWCCRGTRFGSDEKARRRPQPRRISSGQSHRG